MDLTTGTTCTVTFPHGMAKTDFAKCLRMARRLGTYSGSKWTITITGPHAASCVSEMADRGATVEES